MTDHSDKPTSIEPVHQIRLLGPCRLALKAGGKTASEVRVKIPAAIEKSLFQPLPDSKPDCFLLVRNFGKPAGLEDSQHLSLSLDGFAGARRVHLNRESENPISAIVLSEGEGEFALPINNATILLPRNRIEIEFDPNASELFAGEIRLLIFD